MTALTFFRTVWDWSTHRVEIQLDAEAGYAIQGARNDFEANGSRRIFNWIGAGNWLYRDYHGRAAGQNADSYSTFMRTNYAIIWDIRNNGIMLDLNGVAPSPVIWPHRYNTGLYETLANARDSWSADFKAFTTTWLSAH